MSDFQAESSRQGRVFEEAVETILRISGWGVTDHHAIIEGVEVDIVAKAPDGTEWWIECKGSWRGLTPGSKRGDTVKKAVGVAWFLSQVADPRPYMLITSHYPREGTVGHRLLTAAKNAGLFADIRVIGFDAGFDIEEADD